MRFCYLILMLFYVQLSFGQDSNNIDSLIIDFDEEKYDHCDSIIDVEIFGNIEYKLIFKQVDTDIRNKNLIMVPHSKVCTDDKSIIFSDDHRFTKTILKLDYDTCYILDYKEKDNNRKYSEFVASPDTAGLKKWNVTIEYYGNHCSDTDYNFVRVSRNDSNYIDFSCLHNIQVFEMDLNKDGKSEVYLISYIWCSSEIRIYRIS